jgi:hypothetical protein
MQNRTQDEIKSEIKSLNDDPLGVLLIKEWSINSIVIRWNSGTVQHRHKDESIFTIPFGIDDDRT